jgi:hypothetical protein
MSRQGRPVDPVKIVKILGWALLEAFLINPHSKATVFIVPEAQIGPGIKMPVLS